MVGKIDRMVKLSLNNRPLISQMAAPAPSTPTPPPSDDSSSSSSSSSSSCSGCNSEAAADPPLTADLVSDSETPAMIEFGVWLDEEMDCPFHRECCGERGKELEDAEEKGQKEGEDIKAPYGDLVDGLYHSVRPVIFHRARRMCFQKMMLDEDICQSLSDKFDSILAHLGQGDEYREVCVAVDFCEASPKKIAAVAAVALAQQGGPPTIPDEPSVIVSADHGTIFFPKFT